MSLTPQEIRDAINASPELKALAYKRNDVAIAAALSVGWSAATQEVEAWKAQRYFIKRGKWRAIVAAAENVSHPAQQAAIAAVDLTVAAGMRVDFADASASTAGMWYGMVATGLCDAKDRDEIKSWCRIPLVVTLNDVRVAIFADNGDMLV